MTQANLLSFVIANLDAGHRLMLALSTCENDCREKVLQSARITTAQLRHALTTSAARLQHIMNQISKLIITKNGEAEFAAHITAHYHLLALAKARLVGQIKKLRIKLVHLDQLNRLLSAAVEQQLPILPELLKSMHYISTQNRNIFLKDIPDYSALHDEL